MAIHVEVTNEDLASVKGALEESGHTVEEVEEAASQPEEEEPIPQAAPPKVEKPAARAEAAPSQEDEDWEKLPPWAKKQITKLREEKRTLRDRLEDERAAAPKRAPAGTVPQPPAEPVATPPGFTYCGRPKPKLSDFEKAEDPYASHAEALAEWYADEKIAKATVETNIQAQMRAQQEMLAAFEDRKAEARTRIPDFDQVMEESADLMTTGIMQQVIYTSEIGPELMVYLAQHPDECEQIFNLGQYEQLPNGRIRTIGDPEAAKRAMHRLEGRLEAQKPPATMRRTIPRAPAQPPSRKPVSSAAPPPETPLRGKAVTPSAEEQLSPDRIVSTVLRPNAAYRKMREEQRRGR